MSNVNCVYPAAAELGEGPLWSAREHALWFVDIKRRRIHRYDERTRTAASWPAPEQVGFIVPAAPGHFICGLQSGLHSFDPQRGTFELIVRVDADRPGNRLNDAHVDTAGRLWFGSMDDAESAPTGALYRYDAAGLTRCDDGYAITNGPATSPDGRTLYHIDTLRREIYAFDMDASGSLSHKRIFARVAAHEGFPDGPVVDSTGCVWVGLYAGWGVNRYSPEGKLLDKLALPVANCTKAAFGGDDLRTLYMTTARQGLTDEQRVQQPLAGGLFATRVDVAGLPANPVMDVRTKP